MTINLNLTKIVLDFYKISSNTKNMDRLIETIETKYSWIPEYKIVCSWAEMAFNEGVDAIDIVDYISKQIFKKAQKGE